MKLRVFVVLMTAAVILAPLSLVAQDSHDLHGQSEPPMAGIHWAKGQGPGPSNGARPVKSPNLTWHGGPVLHGSETAAIFWGTSWSDATFVGDKISGLDDWYAGFGGSPYAGSNTEYTDGTGNVGTGSSYGGHIIDTTAAPPRAPKTSAILAEVCKVITNPVENGYYAVYVDTPRGHAGYCAWHSTGTCGGTQLQFAFFFNLDGDAGCDPNDTSGLHSQGLAALANVTGHELSEAVTDPHLDAWYDANGAENSDKCAWSFSGTPVSFGGTQWKIQGNWSNAAYDAGTGFANRSGQPGCIDGN